jgi:hypothetical protein
VVVTTQEIEDIADAAADKAVEKTFLLLGVNIRSEDDVKGLKADLIHLKAWRESVNTVKSQGLRAAVTVIVTGALGLLWLALKGQ